MRRNPPGKTKECGKASQKLVPGKKNRGGNENLYKMGGKNRDPTHPSEHFRVDIAGSGKKGRQDPGPRKGIRGVRRSDARENNAGGGKKTRVAEKDQSMGGVLKNKALGGRENEMSGKLFARGDRAGGLRQRGLVIQKRGK